MIYIDIANLSKYMATFYSKFEQNNNITLTYKGQKADLLDALGLHYNICGAKRSIIVPDDIETIDLSKLTVSEIEEFLTDDDTYSMFSGKDVNIIFSGDSFKPISKDDSDRYNQDPISILGILKCLQPISDPPNQ